MSLRPTCSTTLSPPRSALGLLICLAIGMLATGVFLASMSAAAAQDAAAQEAAEDFRPDLTIAEQHLRHGRYDEALRHAQTAVDKSIWNERWYLLAVRLYLLRGDYESASQVLELGLRKYSSSLQLRWLGRDVYRGLDQPEKANELLDTMSRMAEAAPWRYSDRANRVLVGQLLLEQGADPRRVIDLFFERVKERYPDAIEAYLAIADVALQKRDYKLAGDELQQALQRDEENPELLWRLAEAFLSSDRRQVEQYLSRCLSLNANCVPARLLLVDQALAGEAYEAAQQELEKIFEIDPKHPVAWSYRAVLAHLGEIDETEAACRDQALSTWSTNPEVDYVLGRELSEKYRFREGAEAQRRALALNPQYLPAKIQLTQDLLRLGQEDESWELLQEVREADRFNVVAFNLETLAERLAEYRTLEAEGLVVKMERREADLYGDEALELLLEARQVLASKYACELPEPILVEIFSDQSDFAIRTFGLPGGDGFLGVCFGTVITVNGPAAQRPPLSNWQAVLWHEFCHVVTLTKTQHRMPRWLSEGLSVYEERQRDPGWGQWMNPTYQDWIRGDELTPVSQLSEAFLRPESPQHLNFAYYESSLVVEYLVASQGWDQVLGLLDDLGAGIRLDEALTRRWGPPEVVDQEFAEFARTRADAFAPGWSWSAPEDLDQLSLEELRTRVEMDSRNLPTVLKLAEQLLAAEQWDEAQRLFERLADQLATERLGWRSLWARALRVRGDVAGEIAQWEQIATHQADAEAALRRLIDLYRDTQAWEDLARTATRLHGLNPLEPVAHEARAEAARQLDQPQEAIRHHRRLLEFETINRGRLNYELAQLHAQLQQWPEAYEAILDALEAAPRFRDAYVLLDQIEAELPDSSPNDDSLAPVPNSADQSPQ